MIKVIGLIQEFKEKKIKIVGSNTNIKYKHMI